MTFDDRPAPAIRLEEARKERGFKTAKAAVDYFGWSYATYKQHEQGIRGIGRAASKYAKAFRVSEAWLLTGQGEQPGPAVPLISFVSAGHLTEPNGYVPSDDFISIPAGGLPAGDWIALKVEGDSMDLFSPPGSIIFVNRREREAIDGGFYVVRTEDGDATYKRYRKDPERLEPETTNREHKTIYPKGPLTIIGRVRRTMFDFPA
ncbi:SOS-response transcriptional repressor LexA [Martelella mediterranea]|uniref:SOS-response transcriptional repressor LexA n=2 Tax=Martelella mediterranea TaxID=293089 RepID=A0A4R3NXA6_9HYPH|nr:SOS-response transcriptional repressor LexA [Martelella mediterranea]